jgi:mscS mechanosensitive ion channel
MFSLMDILKSFGGLKLVNWVTGHLIEIVISIIILYFFSSISIYLTNILDRIFLSKIKDKGVRTFLKSFSKSLVQIFLFYFILIILEINLTSLFALIGALSVVVGFAFKEIIQNIFGGIIILTFRPFKIGDSVQFKEFTGTVTKIEIFYTRILSFQNEIVIIPNGSIIINEIKNLTSQNMRRLDLMIGVDYGSDIEHVKDVIQEIIKDCQYTLENETHVVGVEEFAKSSINFGIYVYVLPENYRLAKFYILEEIKKRFDKEKINIPFNRLDVNIINKE